MLQIHILYILYLVVKGNVQAAVCLLRIQAAFHILSDTVHTVLYCTTLEELG